eukprot:1685847-Amphidinium_carterae.2
MTLLLHICTASALVYTGFTSPLNPHAKFQSQSDGDIPSGALVFLRKETDRTSAFPSPTFCSYISLNAPALRGEEHNGFSSLANIAVAFRYVALSPLSGACESDPWTLSHC